MSVFDWQVNFGTRFELIYSVRLKLKLNNKIIFKLWQK